MRNRSALFAVTAFALALGVSAPAYAGKAAWSGAAGFAPASNRGLMPGPIGQGGRMSLMQIANTLVPLGQVLEAINAQEPGSQLDTNTVIENGKPIYVVRWQASRGRIIIFRVDAETGQIIGRQG
jgi:uncharacterized membrane protein YkoI